VEIPKDTRFVDEETRFALRMHCEDCVLYDDAKDRCAHGYPTAQHRRGAERHLVVFCKDFEVA
jgi:hypothetical protein